MAEPSRRRTLLFLLAAFACLLVVYFFGTVNRHLIGGIGAHIHDVLSLPLFTAGKVPVTLTLLVKIVLFLLGLGVVAHAALQVLEHRVLNHTPLGRGAQFALARVASYVIFALGLVIGLQSFGLNLNSLVVIGGALGLGVGLGLQTVVANFVAGLILLFEQPVRIGDRIEIGGTLGDVVDIRGRSTWVRTNDDIIMIVPNSDLITKQVTNWTSPDRRVRLAVPVGVGYGSDPEQVRSVLLKVAAAHPDVLQDPKPDVILVDFGDNSIDFALRVWTSSKVHVPALLKSELYFAMFAAFRDAEIELPNPQRDLHLRSVDQEAAESLRAITGRPREGEGPQRRAS